MSFLSERIVWADIFTRSRPLKTTDPEVGFINCKRARPTVVFPQPDSPTSPSVSPLNTSKLTSSTALMYESALPKKFVFDGNHTERFLTFISGPGAANPRCILFG